MHVDRGEVQIQELAEGPRPFRALYEHWERHQWSPFEIDFSTDGASFAALDEPTRDGLVLVFAHRFHAEFNVAALLAPFLLAAPDYEVQLLLATQVADEHRHIESVVRVYSDVSVQKVVTGPATGLVPVDRPFSGTITCQYGSDAPITRLTAVELKAT